MLMTLLWVLMPAVVLGTLMSFVLPDPGPPSRTRTLLARLLRDLGGACGALWDKVRPERSAPEPAPDPFVVLSLQLRLGLLAEQIRVLESDPDVYARGRRLQAVRAAYDDLLREACLLAGVDLPEGLDRDDPERFREEIELASRGWSW